MVQKGWILIDIVCMAVLVSSVIVSVFDVPYLFKVLVDLATAILYISTFNSCTSQPVSIDSCTFLNVYCLVCEVYPLYVSNLRVRSKSPSDRPHSHTCTKTK